MDLTLISDLTGSGTRDAHTLFKDKDLLCRGSLQQRQNYAFLHQFNKKELLQLIHSHLREEGFHTAAEALRSEANIRPIKLSLKSNFKSPNQGPRPRKGTFESLESQKPNTKRYQNARPKIQFSRR